MLYPNVKLGKKAAVFDVRVPMLAAYRIPGGLPSAPAIVDWTRKITKWGMMLNDQLGDCTCAALGHAIQDWTLNAKGQMVTLPDSDILDVYKVVGDYVPGNESTDNGAVMLDVCKYWSHNPIAGHVLGGFASLTPTDVNTVKEGIWLYGGIYAGVLLPKTAQSQTVWMRTPGPLVGDAEPGSWGGHAIYILGYDEHYLTCISWGQPVRMTWEWFTAYCDEAYVMLSQDWISNNTQKQAPSGYDYATLLSDQREFRASMASEPYYGCIGGKPIISRTEDEHLPELEDNRDEGEGEDDVNISEPEAEVETNEKPVEDSDGPANGDESNSAGNGEEAPAPGFDASKN